MLIVCPSCATSYMIDPASLGQAGRKVRCARCKSTWFAGGVKAELSAFADSVIAEAQAEGGAPTGDIAARMPGSAKGADIPASVVPDQTPPSHDDAPAADDFGAEDIAPAAETPAENIAPEAAPEIAPADSVPAITNEPMIADAPSLVPPIEHAPLLEPGAGASAAVLDNDDIESFAARRERLQVRRKTKRRSSRWTALILVLLAFNVAMVGARDEVVRYLPQTASLFAKVGLPVNLRHLAFEQVRISKDTRDGVNVLLVDGLIVSKSKKSVEVPRIRFAARNASGQELYTWTALPARSVLGPGETLEFHSQLASPPAGSSDVMVRFVNKQDAPVK